MKWLLVFIALAVPATAQQFDLTEMPAGYQFTYTGDDGHQTVTYSGPDGDRFLFNFVRTSQGQRFVSSVWANRASQLVQVTDGAEVMVASPHDCWPQLGNCSYEVRFLDGEIIKIKSTMYIESGVWFYQRTVKGDAGWYVMERGCVTMDEYGFPIDIYIENSDGSIEWSTRETTQGIADPRANFGALLAVCEKPDGLVS